MNENHPLYNQILHISGTFKEPEKVNIDSEKVNIENKKVNIEEDFTAKTASHVRKMWQRLFPRNILISLLSLLETMTDLMSTAMSADLQQKLWPRSWEQR